MVRRVFGMVLLRYVFRFVSIWEGKTGRIFRFLWVRGFRVIKNGIDVLIFLADLGVRVKGRF